MTETNETGEREDATPRPVPSGSSRLRIAFAFNDYLDPKRIDSWSGLPYFIWHALEKNGAEVTLLPLASGHRKLRRLMKFAIAKMVFRKRYLRDRDAGLLGSYARQIEAALEGKDFDFLFCLGTAEIALVQCNVPIAFWVDASFAGMLNFYDSFTGLQAISIREGNEADAALLERAALAIYASDWAAKTAEANYPVLASKLHVVRYGANLKKAPSTSEIHQLIEQRSRDVCRLLLIGVDWKRKGVDIAVAAMEVLSKRGMQAHLTIVGCQPPPNTRLPANVEVVGYVDKATPAGQAQIDGYLRESHIFFMPSRAEAYGLVFCEACAFGLPCVATEVGGVPSIVESGANGWLLPIDSTADEYASRIQELWTHREVYEAAARNARQRFETHLNWDVATNQVIELMRKHLDQRA